MGRKAHFYDSLAASDLRVFANCRVVFCEVVYCRCLLLLLIRYYCSWLLSAVACCFLLLPIVLFTFPSFSLTSQNPSRMHDFPAISYCFLLFPIISCHFLHVMLFPAISCNRCVMLCPAVSCYFLRFPASFEHFLLCHARSCYFILFLLISCNFLRCLSQRDCDLH